MQKIYFRVFDNYTEIAIAVYIRIAKNSRVLHSVERPILIHTMK